MNDRPDGGPLHAGAVRTALFDLDGTLADTAPELAHALNRLLAEEGRASLAEEAIRPMVSHGATALIRLGFGLAPGQDGFTRRRERLIELYGAALGQRTRLFPGMHELLQALSHRGINWGVVTNKPAFLTEPLIAQLAITPAPACVVSGDSAPNRKPHPEPMLLGCARAGSRPGECLYVGDAERDIEAGRRAGMRTLVALFGYIGSHESPDAWGADGMVRAPHEILEWIERHG